MNFFQENVLILNLTYRCNLECSFCNVIKKEEEMSVSSARRAVFLFLKNKKNKQLKIRFFGGEPLLRFDVIKNVINYSQEKYKNLSFDLTTNGTLINKEIVKFIAQRKRIELILSCNNEQTKISERIYSLLRELNPTINFMITPKNVDKSLGVLRKMLKYGLRCYNFLPAYYTNWTNDQIVSLHIFFKGALEEFSKHKSIRIKNLEVKSLVPLFSSSLCIDCSGDIYRGNMFMDKNFVGKKDKFYLGNIQEINSFDSVNKDNKKFDFQGLLKGIYGDKLIKVTALVDRELTLFCERMKSRLN